MLDRGLRRSRVLWDTESHGSNFNRWAHITQRMPNITLAVSSDLHRRMKAHPEVKWSEVVRRVLAQRVRDLERMEALAKRSELSARDVDEVARLVNEGLLRRYERPRRSGRD